MTRTEEVIQAYLAALALQAFPGGVIATRNQALPARLLQPVAGGLQYYLNVWDGDGTVIDETLGADDPSVTDGYEIEQRPLVEWIVAGGPDADRETAFDNGLIALHDAVKRDVGTGLYLAGAVNLAAIEKITRSGKGLVTDGLPNIKAAEITPLLTFTSSRPF